MPKGRLALQAVKRKHVKIEIQSQRLELKRTFPKYLNGLFFVALKKSCCMIILLNYDGFKQTPISI